MEMKKVALYMFLLLFAKAGFADSFLLNNQITNNNFKIAIQWASSAGEIKDYNNQIKQGEKINPSSVKFLTGLGKTRIDIPKNREYFRVLVWSKESARPDLLTNWVDAIPNKTYTLNKDLLNPIILVSGMGC